MSRRKTVRVEEGKLLGLAKIEKDPFRDPDNDPRFGLILWYRGCGIKNDEDTPEGWERLRKYAIAYDYGTLTSRIEELEAKLVELNSLKVHHPYHDEKNKEPKP